MIKKEVEKFVDDMIESDKKRVMIDPPSGWKYGFPKVYTGGEDGNMKLWLVSNGYPQREIDSCGDYFYVRFWHE